MLADLLVVDILVVGRELVDGATGRELDDAAGHGTNKLQVVGTEKDVALELHEVVVKAYYGVD